MQNINVKQIEKLFSLVVKKLNDDYVSSINLSTNEYWIILTDEWDNFKDVPSPAIASLSDDIERLKKAIEANEIFSYSEFDRISSVLRAISEIMAPTKLVDN